MILRRKMVTDVDQQGGDQGSGLSFLVIGLGELGNQKHFRSQPGIIHLEDGAYPAEVQRMEARWLTRGDSQGSELVHRGDPAPAGPSYCAVLPLDVSDHH